jgi:hypothetical protein
MRKLLCLGTPEVFSVDKSKMRRDSENDFNRKQGHKEMIRNYPGADKRAILFKCLKPQSKVKGSRSEQGRYMPDKSAFLNLESQILI